MYLELIIIPLIAALMTQLIKLITDPIKSNVDFKNILFAYGGMPSTHSAFVSALTAEVGFKEGINSAAFAIALVMTVIIMRDALGFRTYLSKQSQVVNKLVEKTMGAPSFPRLEEKVGHNIWQVLAGLAVGVGVVLVTQLIISYF